MLHFATFHYIRVMRIKASNDLTPQCKSPVNRNMSRATRGWGGWWGNGEWSLCGGSPYGYVGGWGGVSKYNKFPFGGGVSI